MSFAEARDIRPVWVFWRQDSGAVLQVRVQAPHDEELPADDSGVGVLETTLSLKAIKQAHQLVVRNGRVRVRGSLARRR